MEDNKYYTPDISEFYVGFQCEERHKDEFGTWLNYSPVVINRHEFVYLFQFPDKWLPRFRCKYLDKEDIESLGFDETYDDTEGNVWYRNHLSDQIRLCFCDGLSWNIEICDDHLSNLNDTLFKGTIKNKSELKKLLIQLGIC